MRSPALKPHSLPQSHPGRAEPGSAGRPSSPAGVAAAVRELNAVRELQRHSNLRLALLTAVGESPRIELRWQRLLVHKESELAAVVASYSAAHRR
jgi:hypothetical protein